MARSGPTDAKINLGCSLGHVPMAPLGLPLRYRPFRCLIVQSSTTAACQSEHVISVRLTKRPISIRLMSSEAKQLQSKRLSICQRQFASSGYHIEGDLVPVPN